ncbi:MAG TPA: hypothetical protein VED63_10505 [Acidimicrobiales bacterium]|nr:hypothetical protein [Acidimicrobiales bacterium]
MATEILSASPQAEVDEPDEPAELVVSEDLTIVSKSRKKRFRLR